jgi:hypothetical protein
VEISFTMLATSTFTTSILMSLALILAPAMVSAETVDVLVLQDSMVKDFEFFLT